MNVTFAAGWSAGRIYEPFQAPLEDQFNRQELDEQCTLNTAEHSANPPQNPFVKALYNQYDGDLFFERSPWYWADNIEVPTFLIEAWQDEQVGSRATELTERFDPDLPWRMLATNGDHGEYYGSDVLPHIKDFLRFYLAQEVPARYQGGTVTEFVPHHKDPKHWEKDEEKGKGTSTERDETYEEALARYGSEDRVTINWETGAGGDRVPAWSTTYPTWPPPNQEVWRLHITPDGRLAAESAEGTVGYNYAPGIGTQQRGGYKLTGDLPDETEASWTETPADGTYAMFETDILESDKALAGPASVDLLLSSTAPDTDVQVTLTEVRPDGQEMFVQQGWLRASHRAEDPQLSTALRPFQTHLLEDVAPLIPGEATPMRVEIFPFGHVFRAGSKIRLYIEAPHVKPDLWGFALLPTPAQNTIHTTGSSIALPLLEGEGAGAPFPDCTIIRNQPCRPTH
jgi:predicted acyl esterase